MFEHTSQFVQTLQCDLHTSKVSSSTKQNWVGDSLGQNKTNDSMIIALDLNCSRRIPVRVLFSRAQGLTYGP